MKKIFLLLTAAFCFCMANKTFAYSFFAVNNGTTIYYNITSSTAPFTVEVTMNGNALYDGVVVIPSSVTYNSNTYSVTRIGDLAFYGCYGVTSVTIPNSVITIGFSAFSGSGLTSVTIGNSVEIIKSYAFQGCNKLTSISIPNTVTSIGYSAFEGCSRLTSVIIPNSVTNIDGCAFRYCNRLTSITIGASVTTIEINAFVGDTHLTTVHFNAINCTSMADSSQSQSAFSVSPSFTTLTIGADVQKIPDYAFALTNIKEIYSDAIVPPQIYNNTFYNVPNTIPVYVPCGSAGNYLNASFWNNFSNIRDQGLFRIALQSNDITMGSANITQANTCTDNTAIIEAVANTAYRFLQWTDGNTDNPRTITVTQDTAFTARFTNVIPDIYNVWLTANDSNMGVVNGGGNYVENTTITISATANPACRFVQWHDGNTDNPRTITVTQDTVFTAEFETTMYHVTVTANNTSIGRVNGDGDYAANTTVTITAIAYPDYRFVQWHDGNTDNPRTIIVTQDTIFTAEFETIMYHVTVTVNDTNMGTVNGGRDYAINAMATIIASPYSGYRFVRWDNGDTQNPMRFTVTGDTSFRAEFEPVNAIKDIASSVIAIYPNPATDNIHISLPDNLHNAVFTLYDMQGKIVIQKEINNQDAVSVSNLAASIYIYNVITDKQKHTGKLIINN